MILIPVEDIRELMHQELICKVHCNGIDLCHVPNDVRDNDDVDYDFVLLGFQKYAGSANCGDIATANLVDLSIQMKELQERIESQHKVIRKYKSAD